MIEVSIRVIPYGVREDTFEAVTLRIINTADHPRRPILGNYRIDVYDAANALVASKKIRSHVRDEGIVSLLKKALSRVPAAAKTWPEDFLSARTVRVCQNLLEKTP